MKRYNNYHKHDHKGNIRQLDVIVKMEDYCKRAMELGHNTIFTTNHGMQGDIFEAITLSKEYKKDYNYDLKVIVGCECYYVQNRHEKDRSNKHIVIIAMNDNGVKQLNKMLSIANEDGYYYKPRIDEELLMSLNPDDFVITTACVAGVLCYEELVIKLHNKFKDNFFIEVQSHNQQIQKDWNLKAIELSNKYGIKLIHGNDSHYIYKEDSKYRDLFLKGKGIEYKDKGNKDSVVDDSKITSVENSFDLDYPDYNTIVERYKIQGVLTDEQIKESLENTLIFDKAETLTIINDEIKMPHISDNPKKDLNKLIAESWNKRKSEIPIEKQDEYKKAILFEADIINKTNTNDYFLWDYNIVKRAREKYGTRITNTGRGSAPSFYINNLLGLTNIDRLNTPCKLFPTRFMSVERILGARSLPDIDINASDRYGLIKATEDLIGKENCAWMISYKPLQDSSAFRLYCKAIDMNISEYENIAKDLDKYREDKYWKPIIEESKIFIGVVVSISESPCSMLLAVNDVSENVGLIKIKNKKYPEGRMFCLLDGYNCDKYKYLKNDYLTVSVWSIIEQVFNLVNVEVPTINQFNKMLDDKTFDIYKNGLTCTINQADSDYATELAKRYSPRTLSEMSQFVAIIRPGCKSLLNDFLDRKPYSTGIKKLDDLLEDSGHRMIYQESIMKYLIWLGIKESESYDIIKKISKKKFKEAELKELKGKLLKGWIDKVGTEEGFEETWIVVEQASKYSFNASHSLSYAYDSLYGAYLKSHYPLEYYSVVLNEYDGDEDRTKKLIKELEYWNIQIKPPKFRYSKAKYMFDKESNSIYKGISSIKYLNEDISNTLYDEYKNSKFETFIDLIHELKNNTNINFRQLNILIKLNYFDEFGKNKKLLELSDLYEQKLKNKNLKQETKDKRLLELKAIEKELDNKSLDIKEQLKAEIEYLGYGVTKIDKMPNNVYIVISIDKNNYKLYNLKDGFEEDIKCNKADLKKNPFGEFNVIKKLGIKKKPKRQLNSEGEWVQSETEFNTYLTNWSIIL